MKVFLLCSLIGAFSITKIFSQAPAIEWQNTIGGTAYDYLLSVGQTSDGGYIIGGHSYSEISGDKTENNYGETDIWILRLDASGSIQWQNTIGADDFDFLVSVRQTPDGGYIAGGSSYSYASGDKSEDTQGGEDYWVIKMDSSGIVEWENTIGGAEDDALHSLALTTDGGYLLGGVSYSGISGDKTEDGFDYGDFWVIKLNSEGDIEWQNTIGGIYNDYLFSAQQTSDGGYILGGYSNSPISGDKTEGTQGNADYWVVKLNTTGDIVWQNTIGGSGSEEMTTLVQTSEGGYFLAGYSFSDSSGDKTEDSRGGADFWVVKMDGGGNIEWQNTMGGSLNEYLYSAVQTTDGGYLLGGSSNSDISGDKTEDSKGLADYWSVKLSSAGAIEWQHTIGGTLDDYLRSVQETNDGGYLIGGWSNSGITGDKTELSQGGIDYWVLKLYPPDSCHAPFGITTTDLTSSSAKLNWDAVSGASGYKIRHKIAGTNGWIIKSASGNFKKIKELLPGTEYVWQVKTICEVDPIISSDWSQKQFFTTGSERLIAQLNETTFRVCPNPISDFATVQFNLTTSSNTEISILDIAGRKLKVFFQEMLPEGDHRINFSAEDFPEGIFILCLKRNDEIVTEKLVIN